MEIATRGDSSWMPYAPQGVKGTVDDEHANMSHIFTKIHKKQITLQ
jgi:hypothetical protein